MNVYLCGPTVYDSPHIGNLRPIMFFDILLRAEKALGTKINFVHNITDIDDKIINKALEEKTSEKTIAEKYLQEYLQLLRNLNISSGIIIEKVTDNLMVIDKYIQELLSNQKAYQIGTNVFLEIKKVSSYGIVSHQKIENLVFEEEHKLIKKNPEDFTLWKDTNLGIKFQSTLGLGRPGWHTECAAIINKHFGSSGVDIHGGGIDLKFPHHENENAQHFALYKKNIAKHWLWTGLINIDAEKMSKSKGNFLLATTFLNEYDPDLFRLIILTTSSSSTIELTTDLIKSNLKTLNKYKNLYFQFLLHNSSLEIVDNEITKQVYELVANFKFAEVNKILHHLVNQASQNAILLSILHILGFKFTQSKLSIEDQKIYQQWVKAREQKEYKVADELRKILKNKTIL